MAMLTSADMKSKEERAHTLASSAASHATPSHAGMRATLRGRSSARSSCSEKSHSYSHLFCFLGLGHSYLGHSAARESASWRSDPLGPSGLALNI